MTIRSFHNRLYVNYMAISQHTDSYDTLASDLRLCDIGNGSTVLDSTLGLILAPTKPSALRSGYR